jgi:hypothetical protein
MNQAISLTQTVKRSPSPSKAKTDSSADVELVRAKRASVIDNSIVNGVRAGWIIGSSNTRWFYLWWRVAGIFGSDEVHVGEKQSRRTSRKTRRDIQVEQVFLNSIAVSVEFVRNFNDSLIAFRVHIATNVLEITVGRLISQSELNFECKLHVGRCTCSAIFARSRYNLRGGQCNRGYLVFHHCRSSLFMAFPRRTCRETSLKPPEQHQYTITNHSRWFRKSSLSACRSRGQRRPVNPQMFHSNRPARRS